MFCERCGHRHGNDGNFCENCGSKREERIPIDENKTEESIIKRYFRDGYSYKTILLFLKEHHSINFSLRTLKRRLRYYGMNKRQNTSITVLKAIMKREIEGPSSRLGYRSMLYLLRSNYGIRAPRNVIMKVLQEMDPLATEFRKARKLKRRQYTSGGPNDTWHVDGYDKLKPYGLPIHGAVDGFSRKILWLEVCRSNNNPVVPARYFVETVQKLGTIPKLLRTDCGTENGAMASIQCALSTDDNAHRYGSSIANQRIENWWSSQRRIYTGWLIDFFKNKVAEGTFITGSSLHLEISWFSFSNLLQRELTNLTRRWNAHYIRKSYENVAGIPNELFYLPGSFGYDNCGKLITDDDIDSIEGIVDIMNEGRAEANATDNNLQGYFHYVLENEGLLWPPSSWDEAELIFNKIIDCCT